MDCKEAQKEIQRFITDDLDSRELQNFMKHIEECENCREELSIQYLITEGMQRLEYGNTFDLQRELELKLENAVNKIKTRKRALAVMYVVESLAILAVILMTIMVIIK